MGQLRITGGMLKGRRISLVKGGKTRYTSGKVREAVFDIIGDVAGFYVLDLFAGAGSFTVEAISRGVRLKVIFDDSELLLRLLDLLQKDHYLERDIEGNYAFRFPLIRRWWRFDRSLAPANS